MARKITALPSIVVFKDGTKRELKSLDKNERKLFNEQICRSINETMSDYYTHHQDDWNDLCKKMAS